MNSCRKKFRHLVEDTFSKNPEIIEVLPNKANVVATKLLPHYDSLGMIQVWMRYSGGPRIDQAT